MMRDLKQDRKAVVEVQFNWIFILFAGALILVFFIMIINKQKDLSDRKLSVEVLNSLDRIMSGQRASENRQDIINMFEVEMLYSCGGCDCDFSLSGMSKSKGTLVVFAPSSMESDRLLTWTQSWDMPFRVTNFIYLTVPENRYYFIDPPEHVERDFLENLPANLTYEIVKAGEDIPTIDDIEFRGEQKVRLVFFGDTGGAPDMPQDLEDVDDTRVTALVIDDTGPAWMNGNAEMLFYLKRGDVFVEDLDEEQAENSYPALGFSGAYGAVYSDSFQNFKCNMDDAVKRFSFVAEVYKERSWDLAAAMSNRGDSGGILCGTVLNLGYTIMQAMESSISSMESTGIFQAISDLNDVNDNAILNSCPRIY
ncbi:hypothetical protein GF345_00405 [Candidatus Woesearchaeota archaeon]|nr:hypothetical protein [Candidatus Woesearchaeota archaeon]